MEGHARLPRVGLVLLLAIGASTCAARSVPPTVARPSPFPRVAPPAGMAAGVGRPPRRIRTEDLLRTALSFEGTPYLWGGEDPATGFDCSGFVKYVLAQHEMPAPRTAAEQFRMGTRVGLKQVRAGDLVFFSTIAPGASHVGMAISGEEFVHAPASNGVVRTERVQSTYWKSRFVGARRVI